MATRRLPILDGGDKIVAAQLPIGTGAGTVAAGDDSRITGALPIAGGAMSGALTVNKVANNATLPLGITGLNGTGAQATGLSIVSSYAGGEDEAEPGQFDSTGRLNLYSYQRADRRSYGENIRRFLMKANAKSMDAWYAARQNGAMTHGYDGNGDPDADANWVPVAWTGAHWEANDGGDPHGHWSVEVPDSTGAVQTRFEVPFTDPSVAAADRTFGVDVTNITTNLADLTVRATDGQVLRIGAGNTHKKDLLFSLSGSRDTSSRRWAVRVDNDTEGAFGSDQGSSWQLMPYTDAGVEKTPALHVARNTGNVGVGTTTPGSSARLTTVWSGSGIHGFYARPSADPATGAAYAHAAFTNATTERTISAGLFTDASARYVVYANGRQEWGDGTGGRDVTLYRSAADVLATDDSVIAAGRMTVGVSALNVRKFYVEDATATNNTVMVKATVAGTAASAILAIESSATGKRIFDYRVTGDGVSRLRLDTSAGSGSGTLTFGDGTTADTNLYRSAATTLATDNSLTVGATFRHLGSSLGFYNATATTKPTITGSRGGNTALASLLTSLATLGLITDTSTA